MSSQCCSLFFFCFFPFLLTCCRPLLVSPHACLPLDSDLFVFRYVHTVIDAGGCVWQSLPNRLFLNLLSFLPSPPPSPIALQRCSTNQSSPSFPPLVQPPRRSPWDFADAAYVSSRVRALLKGAVSLRGPLLASLSTIQHTKTEASTHTHTPHTHRPTSK